MTTVELELICELSACAALSQVLRSVDDRVLSRLQLTAPVDPSFEQLAVLAAMTREVPVPIASTAAIDAANATFLRAKPLPSWFIKVLPPRIAAPTCHS